MTPQAQRIAIGEFCNASPRVEWWAYKDSESGGTICMSAETKEEVQHWLDNLPEGSWAKEYRPKEHLIYPDYLNDLNACAELCERLAELGWRCELKKGLDSTWECIFFRKRSESTKPENQGERREFDPPFSEEHYCQANTMAEAICRAALRTIGKCEDHK